MNIDQKIDSQELGVSAYKGFKKNMTCNGFQYEEGKSYKYDGTPILCEKGFHACLEPLEVFKYYLPSSSVFHKVRLSGCIQKSVTNSKICASGIEVGEEVSPYELAYEQIARMKADGRVLLGGYTTDESTPAISDRIAVSNGIHTTAITTGAGIAYTHSVRSFAESQHVDGTAVAGAGTSMAAALTGDATTLGHQSVAATVSGHAYTGEMDSVAATSIGVAGVQNVNSIAASISGRSVAGVENSVAITVNGAAAGAKGSYLIFASVPLEGNMQIHTVYVDGERVKEGVFYQWNKAQNILVDYNTNEVIDDYYTEEVDNGS